MWAKAMFVLSDRSTRTVWPASGPSLTAEVLRALSVSLYSGVIAQPTMTRAAKATHVADKERSIPPTLASGPGDVNRVQGGRAAAHAESSKTSSSALNGVYGIAARRGGPLQHVRHASFEPLCF